MRAAPYALAALALIPGCDARVLYTVEGTLSSSSDGAPIPGIRATCEILDDPESAGEGVSDEAGAYACSAVLDATTTGRGPRTLVVRFVDEDDAQNGSWRDVEREVTVAPDATERLDVQLDPAG